MLLLCLVFTVSVLGFSSGRESKDNLLKEWIFQLSGHLGSSFNIHSPLPSYVNELPASILSCRKPSEGPTNILILGGSVNRMMVEEWCIDRGAKVNSWGPQFKYNSKKGASPSATCQVGHVRIAFLHMYGSPPVGPYFGNNFASRDDPYVDTEVRIPEAIKYYSNHFGKPNFVLFRTELWDLQTITVDVKYIGVTKRFNESWYVDHSENVTGEFINNQMADIDQIRSILPSAYVGSHTVPTIKWGLHMFHHYTNSMRYLSSLASTFLFDFNLMLLNSVDQKDAYLRDYHHPNHAYTVRFVDIIVRALQAGSRCTVVQSDAMSLQGIVRLANHSAYYVTYGVRRPILTEENYEFYSHFLPILLDLSKSASGSGSSINSNVQGIDVNNALVSMQEGAPLSGIFQEGSLLLPPGTTEVYWLTQGKKRPVSSIKVFYTRGWDLSDVKHFGPECEFEFGIVPLGDII